MKKFLLLLAATLIIFGCSEDSNSPNKPVEDINELVRNAGIVNTEVIEKRDVINERMITETDNNNFKWDVKETTYSFAKNLDRNIIPFQPNANSLWAGAIVKGSQVPEGILNSIGDNIPREDIEITVKSGDKLYGSSNINNPSNSTYSKALSELLKDASGNSVANMIYKEEVAYSKEQSMLDLNIGAKWLLGSNFETNFNTSNSRESKNIIIYFKQEYYTVSVNEPSTPSDYFGKNINVEQLEYQLQNNEPLCYVASVTYGRMLIANLQYEGYAETEDIRASVNGFLSTLINGNGEYEYDYILENMSFSGCILGGSAGGAAKALTGKSLESIVKFINEEANYSSNSPGYPISYTVKNLSDNSLVKLGETTKYIEKDYELKTDDFEIELKGFLVLRDCDPDFDGRFLYEIDVKNNFNQSVIYGEKSIKTHIDATDGQFIPIQGSQIYNFKIGSMENASFTIKGKITELNHVVQNIEVNFEQKFSSPWDFDQFLNGNQYGFNGYHSLDIYRDNGCKFVLIFKVSKR